MFSSTELACYFSSNGVHTPTHPENVLAIMVIGSDTMAVEQAFDSAPAVAQAGRCA